MAIEGLGNFDDLEYYKGLSAPLDQLNSNKAATDLQNKVSECFRAEVRSLKTNNDIKPFMIKVGYSQKEKDGKERKIEVEIDTRDTREKPEPPSNKETKAPENKKDEQDPGK